MPGDDPGAEGEEENQTNQANQMKPKTGREWMAEVAELRRENEKLRAQVARLNAACNKWSENEILHPIMNCAWCGELQTHGHDCRTK